MNHLPKHQPARAGFTLTEMAIVMGLIGVVLSGIWAAATEAYDSYRLEKANEEIMMIVDNVRQLYSAAGQFSQTTHTDITASLVTRGIFPQDMINTSTNLPVNPWGTSVIVYAVPSTGGATSSQFEVQFEILPSKDMCALLATISGDAKEKGLLDVYDDNSWHDTTGATLDPTSFSCSSGNFSTAWNLRK